MARDSTRSSTATDADLSVDAFDTALSRYFKPNRPGAAIIVTKNGKTVFRKAYGLADLEHRIPLQPEMVLRLGSVTKQFTAAAVMLLADEGRLAVTDEITRYLPDYPAQGKHITIEHLLTHTSGIKSYTDMPAYREIVDREMTVEQMIDYFKNEPIAFEPGTRFAYSNSGYFLLGAIIEKISGMSYAAFMAERLFEPLGMKQTAYEGHERHGRKRVEGCSRDKKAASISMTQPYAAGALVSTVDDLALWDAAITSGKLLKAETWRQIFTPYPLKNGKRIPYAYGWLIGKFIKGRATQLHGGGISGFTSQVIRLPDDAVYVAVLMNDDGGEKWYHQIAFQFSRRNPATLAAKAAAIAIGLPP